MASVGDCFLQQLNVNNFTEMYDTHSVTDAQCEWTLKTRSG